MALYLEKLINIEFRISFDYIIGRFHPQRLQRRKSLEIMSYIKLRQNQRSIKVKKEEDCLANRIIDGENLKASYSLSAKGIKHVILILMQQKQESPPPSPTSKILDFFQAQLHSIHDLDDLRYSFGDGWLPQNHTAASVRDAPKLKMKAFSKKKLTPKFQISFEKDFMKQHKAVFGKYYQNHIESIRAKLPSKKVQQFLRQFYILNPQTSSSSASNLLKNQESSLSDKQVLQFLKDLEHQEKFSEFLDYIVSYFQPKASVGFLGMAQSIWMSFVPLQSNYLQISEIVEIGEEIWNSSIKYSLAKYFSAYADSEECINQEFNNLAKAICTTILLTITGYFENPYHSEHSTSDYKRSLDVDPSSQEESQESNSFIPSKKRKLQTP